MIPPQLWPWKLIAKTATGVVLSALLVWLFLVLKSWHDDAAALPAAQTARDAAIAETARVRKDLGDEVFRLQSVNQGLIDEKTILSIARAATPVRTVRLCSAASETRATVARDPPPAGGDHAAATGTGLLPEEARRDPEPRPDVGPDLYGKADEADDYLRLLRAAQTYIAGLPKACTVTQ